MRQRLYLETMESVLAKSTKVVIEPQGNQMLYLPLDRLAPAQAQPLPALPDSGPAPAAREGR